MSTVSWKKRIGTVAALAVLSATAVACSSTKPSTTPTSGGSGSTTTWSVPASAVGNTTGITAQSVDVGTVYTGFESLFLGSKVGTEAYAAYVNSTGGVNGRKIVVDPGDDNYTGSTNKQLVQQDITKDFAMVGGFSLQDSYGGTVLAANPDVPNVSVTLDAMTNSLPNTYSIAPLAGGWEEGPFVYLKGKYPADIDNVGTLVADQPSAVAQWNGEHAMLTHIGYNVTYDATFDITQLDFNANVIAMKDKGVKMVLLEQQPYNYAAAIIKAFHQQNFNPVVVLGASVYSDQLIPAAGGASAVQGYYLEQNMSLYQGQDSATVPAVSTFQTWVQKVDPGFKPDLYTLYGWASAALFAQALKQAGANPTRASVLTALHNTTTFDADHIIAPANPSGKLPENCYLLGKINNGQYQRLADPPVNSSTYGYRCDNQYYLPPGA